jgi:S-adenosylmethionine decarboxylase
LKKEYCGSDEFSKYAGTHLIIELWDGEYFTDKDKIQEIMLEAAEACSATVLSINLHEFSSNGVSGVVVLKESHISIHTWPEYKYAAMDIFVCGTCNPHKSIPVLKEGFKAKSVQVIEIKRGLLN